MCVSCIYQDLPLKRQQKSCKILFTNPMDPIGLAAIFHEPSMSPGWS